MATRRQSKPPAATPSAASLRELGATGLKHWGGFVREEFVRELQGPRGMKILREMRDNSAVVGACLGAIEMLIRQIRWYVDPASSSTEDQANAAFVDECRNDMSHTWSDLLSEVASMFTFGHAYHEVVLKRRLGDVNDPTKRSMYNDGRIGWRKIPIRGQESLFEWKFDGEGGVQGMVQLAPTRPTPTLIPIEKALLFRAKKEKENPEGRSILRNAYFSWYFGKKIAEIEGIGIARDLAGLPIIWIPVQCFLPGATTDQKATLAVAEKIVRNVSRDEQEGLVLPIGYDDKNPPMPTFRFELATTGGKRQFDTGSIIDRYDRRIAMSIMFDLVMMGQPNTTLYKGKNMPEFFATSLSTWADAIRDVINAHAIPRLLRLNGIQTARRPKLQHGDVVVPDLAALGDYISKMAGAKMPLFDRDWNFLRRAAGMDDEPTDPKERERRAPPADDPPPAGDRDDPADAEARTRGWVRAELAELGGAMAELREFIEVHTRAEASVAAPAPPPPAPTQTVSTTLQVPDQAEAIARANAEMGRTIAEGMAAVVTATGDAIAKATPPPPAAAAPAPDPTEGLARLGAELGKGVSEQGGAIARGMVEAAKASPAPVVTTSVSVDARTTVTGPDQTEGLARLGAELGKGVSEGISAAGALMAEGVTAAAEASKPDGPQDMNILSMPDRRQSIERDGDGKMSGTVERDEPGEA